MHSTAYYSNREWNTEGCRCKYFLCTFARCYVHRKSNLGQIMKCNKGNWELVQVNLKYQCKDKEKKEQNRKYFQFVSKEIVFVWFISNWYISGKNQCNHLILIFRMIMILVIVEMMKFLTSLTYCKLNKLLKPFTKGIQWEGNFSKIFFSCKIMIMRV